MKRITTVTRKISKTYIAGIIFVLILGLKHFSEMSGAVSITGHTWLLSQYMLLLAAVLIFICLIGYMLTVYAKDIRPEYIFILTALTLGIMYMVVLPPLSASDESSHYISAYKLSNEMMGKQSVDEEGHVYIRSEDKILETVHSTDETKSNIFGMEADEEVYAYIHERGLTGISRDGTETSVLPVVRTTPLIYVPQAIGITLARILSLSCIGLLYMGRLFNLIFYVIITMFSIKRIPFGKKVLLGISLLPMVLNLTGSMSYDTMIMALVWYFTALCIDLAYSRKKVEWYDILKLAAVIAIAGPCKLVYAVILGLCLLIPVKKFNGTVKYILSALFVAASYAVSMVLVNLNTISIYTADDSNYVGWAEESGYTFSYLLHDPGRVINMFYNTIIYTGDSLHMNMIGSQLGNLDPVLNVPYIIIFSMTIALIILALKKPGEEIQIRPWQKCFIWFLCLLSFAAIMFSMLLTWTPISAFTIDGVQGRYLLPLLLVFLLTCKNDFIVCTRDRDYKLIYLMCCANGYAVLRLFSIVSRRL